MKEKGFTHELESAPAEDPDTPAIHSGWAPWPEEEGPPVPPFRVLVARRLGRVRRAWRVLLGEDDD